MAGEIVLGYDDTRESRAALPVAVELARSLGTKLVIGFGYEPPRSGGEVGALRGEIEKLGEEFATEAVSRVHDLDPDLDVEVQLVQDRPIEAIVRLADSLDARLIVVATASDTCSPRSSSGPCSRGSCPRPTARSSSCSPRTRTEPDRLAPHARSARLVA